MVRAGLLVSVVRLAREVKRDGMRLAGVAMTVGEEGLTPSVERHHLTGTVAKSPEHYQRLLVVASGFLVAALTPAARTSDSSARPAQPGGQPVSAASAKRSS